MEKSTSMEGYFEYTINLNEYSEDTKVKVCFNNGNSVWDNNNRNNYSLTEGSYIIENGTTKECENTGDVKANKIICSPNIDGSLNMLIDMSNITNVGQVFYTIRHKNDVVDSLRGDSSTLASWTPKDEGEYSIEAFIIWDDSL